MGRESSIDVLMVTYNRPRYTEVSLRRLLRCSPAGMSVWIWHNGNDRETRSVVESFANHPRVIRYKHSPENRLLREPTNWFMRESRAPIIGKVDDDLLLPDGWQDRIRNAHEANPEVGVLGCWPFAKEDVVPEKARQKIVNLSGDEKMMLNCWVGGGGVFVKRECVERVGKLREGESFPHWMMRVCRRGYMVGWLYPFLVMENMDDPRSKYCRIKTDQDIARYAGLSAGPSGVSTVTQLIGRIQRQAAEVQEAPYDIGRYIGPRAFVHRCARKFKALVVGKQG